MRKIFAIAGAQDMRSFFPLIGFLNIFAMSASVLASLVAPVAGLL